MTHHSPGSISYLGIFFKALNHHLDEAVVVVVTRAKQNLADDVRGGVVKKHLRTQGCTCDRCTDDDTLGSEHYLINMRSQRAQLHTNALFQRFHCVLYLSQNPLLHGLLSQTKIPQGHQSKATVLPPACAIVCQNHSYKRCGYGDMMPLYPKVRLCNLNFNWTAATNINYSMLNANIYIMYIETCTNSVTFSCKANSF